MSQAANGLFSSSSVTITTTRKQSSAALAFQVQLLSATNVVQFAVNNELLLAYSNGTLLSSLQEALEAVGVNVTGISGFTLIGENCLSSMWESLDTGYTAVCGNGVVDVGEQCDGD